MTIRFGLCLLPFVLAAGCTTSQSVKAPPPAEAEATQTFAMLPDTAIVPGERGQDVTLTALVAPSEPASSPDMVRSGSVEVVKASSNVEVDRLIASYAASYEVPEALVRRVVKRESNFRPGARNGPYFGLMQILPATARSMGYSGPASGLLDAETNLKYAVKYLKGAYLVAGGNHDQAVRHYARGYYFDAKRKGLLEEAGLTRRRMPPSAPQTEPENIQPLPETVMVSAQPQSNVPIAAALPGVSKTAAVAQTAGMAERWDDGIASAKATVSVDTAPVVASVAGAAAPAAPEAAPEPEKSVPFNAAPASSGKGGRVGGAGERGAFR